MKVSGFTFIRNAIKFDYPVVESITSILSLCDEYVVAVGRSDDETLSLVQSIDSPKIRILETVWDDSLREGGRVLALETDKALDAVSTDSDWAFYLQSDEVVHEDDLPVIDQALRAHRADLRVEGLLFNYRHFYGSYDYVGTSRRWYRREIRVVRPDPKIRSYKDAQGFRKNGEKLRVKAVPATIYHYGWVKHPGKQQEKQRTFHTYWHDDLWVRRHISDSASFDYGNINALERFTGTHPKVMKKRVAGMNWHFSFDPTTAVRPRLKERLTGWIERLTGWRIGEYKNYRIL